jgi:hypothetical protein
MRHEIDLGFSDVSAALGDPKYLAPSFRIPGLARSDVVESEFAAGMVVLARRPGNAQTFFRRNSYIRVWDSAPGHLPPKLNFDSAWFFPTKSHAK